MDKNSKEYKNTYKQAVQTYGSGTSVYRSAYIVKLYKEFGGKFSKSTSKSKLHDTGLTRWFKGEQWIRVVPYLTRGEIMPCGSSGYKTYACRPLKRATSKTPITIKELLKIHSKSDIIKVAKEKEKDPSKRLTWKTLNIS
jgi:hypothetical protein